MRRFLVPALIAVLILTAGTFLDHAGTPGNFLKFVIGGARGGGGGNYTGGYSGSGNLK
jgi:hypothetical protein